MTAIAAYNTIDGITQEELVERYGVLVKRIAHHLLGRLPKTVQVDDLIQAGMLGLLSAAKKYDTSKGASFETYAGIRIRGMMLDEVRKNDWVPRSVYRNSRKVSQAVRDLEHKLGRDARDHEIAEQLEINLKEYHGMLLDINSTQIYGFDDIGVHDDMMDASCTSFSLEPLNDLQKENFHKDLSKSLSSLPERERLVLALYYQEELNLKEIGEILEVSESRVCQIHSQAMLRLQSRVAEWKSNKN